MLGTGRIRLLSQRSRGKVHIANDIAHYEDLKCLSLLAAKRDLRLSREIKRLSRYDGLIIDDLGYLQQSRDDMEVVFTLLAERYERGSVLMTSNLPFSKWEAIFKDAMMTAAADSGEGNWLFRFDADNLSSSAEPAVLC